MAYRISAQETDLVTIDINSYDPEGDALTYEVNDSRFVQDGGDENIFTWQTGYEDEGYHHFFAIVSDDTHESSEEFIVKINQKNKAPELLMEIPVQEWEEDTNHTLNLSSY